MTDVGHGRVLAEEVRPLVTVGPARPALDRTEQLGGTRPSAELLCAAGPRLAPLRGACRPPLLGPAEAGVCIIGAGRTGLWSAYPLKKA